MGKIFHRDKEQMKNWGKKWSPWKTKDYFKRAPTNKYGQFPSLKMSRDCVKVFHQMNLQMANNEKMLIKTKEMYFKTSLLMRVLNIKKFTLHVIMWESNSYTAGGRVNYWNYFGSLYGKRYQKFLGNLDLWKSSKMVQMVPKYLSPIFPLCYHLIYSKNLWKLRN